MMKNNSNALSISLQGLDLIKQAEGCRLRAYRDSAEIWTIGYGHTAGVKAGDRITPLQADKLLREDVRTAEADVNRLVTVPLTQGQFDALCSFTFNLGSGNLSRSKLLLKLNAGDYDGAAAEFPKWCRTGGKRLPGLVRRRNAEQARFLA